MAERNKTLENMLSNARAEQTNILAPALREIANFLAGQIVMKSITTSQQVQNRIQSTLMALAPALYVNQCKMARSVYIMANAATAEAIAQASNEELKFSAPNREPSASKNQEVYNRIILYLDRLTRRIMDAYQLSAIMEEDSKDSMNRILRAMPKREPAKRFPLRNPKLREADTGIGKALKDFALSFLTDEEWDATVSYATLQVLPVARGPEDLIDIPDEAKPSGVEEVYAWEYEQDLTHEFVQSVRDGEEDAANENGISEFVFVAVIDAKTDECCLWRDGLTITEIEEKLAGMDEDDQCMGVEPPLHPNCRCRLEPVLDSIGSGQSTEAKDFETWLKT